jgi:predicted nuclease with TOPRIM domain
MSDLRIELRGEMSEIRADFGTLRGEFGTLRGEFGELRGEFGELRGEFGELRAYIEERFHRQTITMITTMSALMGILFVALKWA